MILNEFIKMLSSLVHALNFKCGVYYTCTPLYLDSKLKKED